MVLESAIDDLEKAVFLDVEKVKGLLNFGGVRIEDDILVTETGYENLTNVPKEIAEIEALMNAT